MKKNIAIVGLGGVGGYFGFKINQINLKSKENLITYIARDKTFKVVSENGLTLISSEHKNQVTKPDFIFDEVSSIENPDLVIICVKEYDLTNVCKKLAKVITPKTIILPMMNGVDIYDRIRTIIPKHTILPACVYITSHIKEKGIIEHVGKSGKLIFGKDPQNSSENLDWIIALFTKSKINFDYKDNVETEIWSKFMFIASFGLVTAKHNSSIGAVSREQLQLEEAKNIMNEIKLIAEKKDIKLPNDIVAKTLERALGFSSEMPTSLQLDVNSGKENNELALFAGAIINYGLETGVNTPATIKIEQQIIELISQKK